MADIFRKKSIPDQPDVSLVVIGGVGYHADASEKTRLIETPYGGVSVSDVPIAASDGTVSHIVLIPRHQGRHHTPPGSVNYRALIAAAAGFSAPVLSVNSVGTMKGHVPGTFFVPDDFIDMTKGRKSTLYEEEAVHVDMTDPYCRSIRKLLKDALRETGYAVSEGVYLATEGPRFETKAEIRMFASFADVVGMTGVPEVCLAKEAGLCYASLCLVTNPACGTAGETDPLTSEEVRQTVLSAQRRTYDVIKALLPKLPGKEKCRCSSAADIGRM